MNNPEFTEGRIHMSIHTKDIRSAAADMVRVMRRIGLTNFAAAYDIQGSRLNLSSVSSRTMRTVWFNNFLDTGQSFEMAYDLYNINGAIVSPIQICLFPEASFSEIKLFSADYMQGYDFDIGLKRKTNQIYVKSIPESSLNETLAELDRLSMMNL